MNSTTIEKTRAICLQIRPWSNTSHIVTWLTDGFGRIVTPVKGAVRPKSLHLGQYDMAYTCELLFYRRDRGGFHAMREAYPLQLRTALRDNWRCAHAASYLCALTAAVGSAKEESGSLFRLLSRALDAIEQNANGDPMPVILWFEAKLLSICGIAPDWRLCPCCAENEAQQWHRFSVPSGKFICEHSAPQTHNGAEQTVSVHRSVHRLFKSFSQAHTPPKRPPKDNANSFLGFCRFLGIFIQYHLDTPPAMRRVAVELLFACKETESI